MQEYWIRSFFRKYFSPLCYRDQLILWQEVAPVKTFSKLAFYVETRLPRNDSQIQHVSSILFRAFFLIVPASFLDFSLAIFSSFSAHLKTIWEAGKIFFKETLRFESQPLSEIHRTIFSHLLTTLFNDLKLHCYLKILVFVILDLNLLFAL